MLSPLQAMAKALLKHQTSRGLPDGLALSQDPKPGAWKLVHP